MHGHTNAWEPRFLRLVAGLAAILCLVSTPACLRMAPDVHRPKAPPTSETFTRETGGPTWRRKTTSYERLPGGEDPDKQPSRWKGWIPPLRTKNPPSEYYFPKGKR